MNSQLFSEELDVEIARVPLPRLLKQLNVTVSESALSVKLGAMSLRCSPSLLMGTMVSRLKTISRLNATVIELWPVTVCTRKHTPGLATASRSSCRVEAVLLVSGHSHVKSPLYSRGADWSMSPTAVREVHNITFFVLRSGAGVFKV